MTTPKSPEQVVKEFLTDFPATNDSDSKELSMYQRKVMKEYLRSSMSSLLLWAAENCSMSKKQREAEDLLFSAVKDGMDDILSMSRQAHARGYHTGQERCRTLLIEEARKITNNE